jgi:predicted O-methyltransferase YrrM
MVNWHFIANFIKHYWSATRIDVLHSPFVFDLYNSCIARQITATELLPVEELRKSAQQNQTPITQQDFGALGSLNKQRTKSIAYFAKTHAKPTRLAHIIYRMVNKYGYQNCVELGTSLGFTSMCIAKGLPNNTKLITIEGAKEIADVAQQHFSQLNLANKIDLRVGNFNELLPDVINELPQVDFAFIDGNHTYEATINYFNLLLQKTHNDSVLIFDDIYWSKGMTQAWEEIKHHPKVTVTVDLFYIGLVYFRTQQVEEHFKLRVL